MIELIDYSSGYHADFRNLNLEWLDQYQLTEPYDLAMLDDPIGKVIEPGGCIFLARDTDNNKIVGTAGLAPERPGVFELVKMTVDPGYRGKGISKRLLEACMDTARFRKAKHVFLFSNSRLTAALNLYRKYGFYEVPVTDSPMKTADIKMEYSFQ